MLDSLPISPTVLVGLLAGVLALMTLFAVGKVPVAYNLRNLQVRWRITVLTALAFTLVVALLIAMLAFVNGMNQLTERAGQPGNVLVLSSGVTDEVMSHLTMMDADDVETQPGILRDDNNRPLCSREVYVVVAQPLPGGTSERPRRRFVQVRGVEDPLLAARVRDVELFPGSTWFSSAGVREVPGTAAGSSGLLAVEVVLGEGVAGEWGLHLGDLFDLGQRQAVVVGIMKSAGTTFGSEVWAARAKVGDTFGKANAYTTLVLRTADAASARHVADELTLHFEKAALQAMPEKEYYQKLSSTTDALQGAIYVIALVIAVGSVFGVMNTMFAAISQRTQDIGVLRLLGFGRTQIVISFLLEALLIALLGGVLGCGLGYLANGWTAITLVNRTKGMVLTLVVDADTLAIGLLFTLCMGVLGGLLPSLSAVRVKPLEALR
jgi:putative ABC transport system permease protein